MGWIVLLAIALLTGAVLIAIRFPMRLWTVGATALTLGAAGYAWQGSPGLAGHPVAAVEKSGEVDPGEVLLRDAMFGQFNHEWNTFNQADAMIRGGKPGYAVTIMRAAVIKTPDNAALWVGLGNTLSVHDRGVSPAARFSFDKAMALAPRHPAPPYFLGLAYIRMGQLAEARPYWVKAVELTPETISYREVLVAQLDLLDRRLAESAAQQRQALGTEAPEPTPGAPQPQ
jgi:cytochrome c-type biogenesis protein CcmH